jgi:hypothetical protein
LAGWNAPVDDGGVFICRSLNVSWKTVMSVGTDTAAYPRTHSPPHGETVGIACFRNHRLKTAALRGPRKNVTSRAQEIASSRRYPQ